MFDENFLFVFQVGVTVRHLSIEILREVINFNCRSVFIPIFVYLDHVKLRERKRNGIFSKLESKETPRLQLLFFKNNCEQAIIGW